MWLLCSSRPRTQAPSICLSLGHHPSPHDVPPLPHSKQEDEETEEVHISSPLLLAKAWFKLLYRIGTKITQLRQELFSLSWTVQHSGAGSVPCDDQRSRLVGCSPILCTWLPFLGLRSCSNDCPCPARGKRTFLGKFQGMFLKEYGPEVTHISPLISYGQKLSQRATPNCKGSWEMASLFKWPYSS